MTENIRTMQDHIRYLETYITEITEKIEEITGGREIEKEISSIEYRLEVLRRSNGTFDDRIAELEKELKKLQGEFAKIRPLIEKLEAERAYYRQVQTELAH